MDSDPHDGFETAAARGAHQTLPVGRPIRAALIGYGNSGRFYHLPHLTGSARYSLELVATSTGSADGLPEGVRAVRGWEAAVHDPAVELVVVAAPHHLHHPVALAALAAGRHVLVEKPLAMDARQGRELIEAARRRGLTLLVHHQRRFEHDFQRLLELVREGELGTPWRIVANRGHQGRYRVAAGHAPHVGEREASWAHDASSGGGVARVIGPHPLDHVLTLADSAVTTVSAQQVVDPADGVEHWIGIELAFADGGTGRVEVFRRSGIAPPRFVVYGTAGTAVAQAGRHIELVRDGADPVVIDGLEPPGVLGDEVYTDLAEAIRTGAPPRVTAEHGLAVVEVLDAAFASVGAGGRAVTLPPPQERKIA